ncbi:MAG: hypothetical protein ACK4SX_12035 [Alcanivoracaceae bacterium]
MSAFQQACAADASDILDLFRRTPQRGRVVLNFEREPDYFLGSEVICEQPDTRVARQPSGELVMLYGIGSRTLYINGAAQAVRYAHDLRVAEQARGGLLIARMGRQVREMVAAEELIQTVILSENSASLNSVASGRAGLPTYYPCGEIETSLVFSTPRRRHHGIEVRRASPADLASMQALHDELAPSRQFYPRYRFGALLENDAYFRGVSIDDFWLAFRGEQLVGMAGLWDQKSFKQTRVLAYPRGLSGLRHLWNLWARLFGGLQLPPAGGTINYLMLHSLLVRDNDSAVFDAMLSDMVQQRGGHRAAISVGFFVQDPLRQALRGYRRQTMQSRHFLIGFHDDPRQRLDQRLPYIELARL